MDRSLPRGWALKRERLHKPDGSFCIEAVAVFQTTRITTMGELERVLDKHYSRKEGEANHIRSEFERHQKAVQATAESAAKILQAHQHVSVTAGPSKPAAKKVKAALEKTSGVKRKAKGPGSTSKATKKAKTLDKPSSKAGSVTKTTKETVGKKGKSPKNTTSGNVQSAPNPSAALKSSKGAPGGSGKKRPLPPAVTSKPDVVSSNSGALSLHSGDLSAVSEALNDRTEVSSKRVIAKADNSVKSHRGGTFSFPTPAEFKFFRTVFAPIADPFMRSVDELHKHYAGQYMEWLALLDLNQSLYFHGIGHKERLLKGFVKTCLAGEDVIEVSCGVGKICPTTVNASGRQQSWHGVISNLLQMISDEILATPLPTSATPLTTGSSTRTAGRTALSNSALGPIDLSHGAVSAFLLEDGISIVQKTELVAEALLQYHGYKSRSVGRAQPVDAPEAGHSVMSYNRPSKLYLIIVDPPTIQSASVSISVSNREKFRAEKALAMRCLGLLAGCKAVGLVAAVNSINTICQGCDLDTLCLFNWAYVHCPTFESGNVELSLQDFGINFASYATQHKGLLVDSADAVDDNAHDNLKYVINSLTRKHKDMLRVLCTYIQEEDKKRKAENIGGGGAVAMPWIRFVSSCTENLIVKGDPDMRYLMRELIDHKLVSQALNPQDGLKSVCLSCPAPVLLSLI